MSHTWFRLYDEVVDDPKVQLLSDRLFRTWINLLCIASKNQPRGTLPRLEETAYRLHLPIPEATAMLNELIEAGLLENNRGRYHCHNWDGRQFQSDSSTERVHRFRKQQSSVSGNASETLPKRRRNVSETPDETHQIQIQKQIQNQEGSLFEDSTELSTDSPDTHSATNVATPALKVTPRDLFEAYNAERGDLPEARELTGDRLKKCHARIRSTEQPGFIEQFRESVRRASRTPFLCGDSAQGWTATFDWFIKNNTNFQKVLEGQYDDKRKSKSQRRTEELNEFAEKYSGRMAPSVRGNMPHEGERQPDRRKT